MTTNTEALRAQFEAWFSGDFPRAVERKSDGEYKYMQANSAWQTYQAGHAAAKAETADVGEPVAFAHFAENGNIRLWAPEMPHDLDGNAAHPLYTADQLAAAVSAERERCIRIIKSYRIPVGNSAAGEMACEWTYDALETILDAIRSGAKETGNG